VLLRRRLRRKRPKALRRGARSLFTITLSAYLRIHTRCFRLRQIFSFLDSRFAFSPRLFQALSLSYSQPINKVLERLNELDPSRPRFDAACRLLWDEEAPWAVCGTAESYFFVDLLSVLPPLTLSFYLLICVDSQVRTQALCAISTLAMIHAGAPARQKVRHDLASALSFLAAEKHLHVRRGRSWLEDSLTEAAASAKHLVDGSVSTEAEAGGGHSAPASKEVASLAGGLLKRREDHLAPLWGAIQTRSKCGGGGSPRVAVDEASNSSKDDGTLDGALGLCSLHPALLALREVTAALHVLYHRCAVINV